MARPRAYVELSMGQQQIFEAQKVAYDEVCTFLAKNGDTYALPKQPQQLDEGQRAIVEEVFRNTKPGTSLRFEPPVPLLVGRVVVELYAADCPKTVENFTKLCTGEKGQGSGGKALHYFNCKVHRIVKDFMLQTGDITRGDGSGGESIWGKKFNDEKDGLKHPLEKKGTLAMANAGKNSNTSQFFLTLRDDCSHLNKKHVVFGHVVDGMHVLDKINQEAATADGTPSMPVWISGCGVLK